MFDWLKGIIGMNSTDSTQATEQLTVIETEEPTIEERLGRLLARLGRYDKQTETDLREIMDDLDVVLNMVEKVIQTLEHIGGAERAKELRRRLRNNRTRAEKAYSRLRVANE